MTDRPSPPTNPLRNSNRLKLGVFGTNGPGASFTNHPDRFSNSWDKNVRLAQLADSLGLESFVSASRWKAFSRDGHYSGDLWETFTWAAGIAAVTKRICVMSTVHVTIVNPILAAKSTVTVDLISNGRMGLNLVCGWYPAEIEMFGNAIQTHGDRYDLADEWIDVFDRLWSEKKSFDYDGDYYQLKGAITQPRPVQSRPILMNAGGSPRGRDFAAEHCDVAFIIPQIPTPEAVRGQVEQYRTLAREKFGKEIQIWMSSYVVQRDSKAEAEAYVQDYVVTQGDDVGVGAFIENNVPNAKTIPDGAIAQMSFAIKAGYGGFPLVGTADDIVATLAALSEAGVDGVLLTWLDYESGLASFAREVLPALEDKGLRAPVSA